MFFQSYDVKKCTATFFRDTVYIAIIAIIAETNNHASAVLLNFGTDNVTEELKQLRSNIQEAVDLYVAVCYVYVITVCYVCVCYFSAFDRTLK